MSTEPPHRDARYWRVRPRRRRGVAALAVALWGIIGAVTAVLLGGYIYLDDTLEIAAPNTPQAIRAREATTPVLEGEPTNILLIGTDSRPSEGDPGRSDSLILVRMDPRRGFISMLSFPRDLYVPIAGGRGTDKINAAYSYGADVTIDTVAELTGQPVNDYVILDFTGFQKLVDTVGGVYLDVDRRYFNQNVGTAATNYDDIDLQPGYQRLDGVDALDYVRYRHTDSTYARDARQQLFLSELKRQTKDLGNLGSFSQFRKIFGENIQISIRNPRRFLTLLETALDTPKERIAKVAIVGAGDLTSAGASIQVASQQTIDEAVAEWKEPEFVSGDNKQAAPVDPATVQVTVLNGAGKVLAAERAAQALATKRWRTSVGGNAEAFDYTSTAVFYAPAYRDAARRIATLMGPTATISSLSSARARGNQVVVVVGADFAGELAAPPPREVEPPPDTVDTTGLVAPLRALRGDVRGVTVMAPLKVATGSSAEIVRAYRINTGSGDNGPPAVKIVFQVYVGGGPRYWGITMTSMKNPPIVQGETGTIRSGGREYLTYYDGRNLQRLAFRVGNTTYWITNTLQNDLSAKTIQEIAKSMRPLNRAKLPQGRTDTPISVETEGSTP